MNVFSRKIKHLALTAAILGIVSVFYFSIPAHADEQTAGTMPVAGQSAKRVEAPDSDSAPDSSNSPDSSDSITDAADAKTEKTAETTKTAETADIHDTPDTTNTSVTEEQPDRVRVETESIAVNNTPLSSSELERIESYGLLTNISDGGLGIDVWQGSEKKFLLNILKAMPSTSGYRTTQDLLHRALLTRNDVSLMKSRDSDEAGDDFLTARIEKLTQMGYFSDAVKLYTENPDKPYHERLARAGISAMMLDGQTSLACLEATVLQEKFKGMLFWQQAADICGYFMGKMTQDKTKPETIPAPVTVTSSKVLQQISENSKYRYPIKEISDFEALSHLEKAILVSEKRIDYSAMENSKLRDFSPLSTSLFMRDESLPEPQKITLFTLRTERGFSSTKSLTDFYESISFPQLKTSESFSAGYKNISDWKRLPFLYQSAVADKINRQEIVSNALILNDKFGISALLPFVPFMGDVQASQLPAESVRTGIKLYALSANKAPQQWLDRWAAVKTDKSSDKVLEIAYRFATGTPLENADTTAIPSDFPEDKKGAGLQILNMLKEKLDKTGKLHKDASSEPYEKSLDLTFGVGYVMPSVSLIDSLERAEEDHRLGEVIVLSSVVLNEVPPAKMYAGLLQKVMYGLETVGLTREARELAMEVVLGTGNEKEN